MRLSVVIPAYNESDNIVATIKEVAAQTPPEVDALQVIVVDDHSRDDTFDKAAAVEGVNVRCLRLSRRSGSHVAIRVGLAAAEGDAVLCIAADGQDDPAAIGRMLEKWRNGAQIVWGLRTNRDNEPWRIRVFAQAFYALLNYFNKPEDPTIDLSRADFYLLDRRVVDAMAACSERFTSLFGLIAWAGFRQTYVEYERKQRRNGGSKWNFRSRTALALDWIIAFSWLPLRFSALLGVIVAALGGLYAVVVVVNALLGQPAEGWSSVMTVILLLSGIQLVILGTIGEYVGRSLDETRKRPIAFIEKESARDGAP